MCKQIFIGALWGFVLLLAIANGVVAIQAVHGWKKEARELEAETVRYVAGKEYDAKLYLANARYNANDRWVKLVHHLVERLVSPTGLQRLEREFK